MHKLHYYDEGFVTRNKNWCLGSWKCADRQRHKLGWFDLILCRNTTLPFTTILINLIGLSWYLAWLYVCMWQPKHGTEEQNYENVVALKVGPRVPTFSLRILRFKTIGGFHGLCFTPKPASLFKNSQQRFFLIQLNKGKKRDKVLFYCIIPYLMKN